MKPLEAEQLLALAREKSAASKRLLTQIVADLFDDRTLCLSERERGLMYDILHGMIREIELSIRKTVSQRIADRPDVPRELSIALANDDIEVAFPILTRSLVLRDEDLIEVIRNRTLEHQLAVTLRHGITEAVSDELVATGVPSVIQRMLENPEAAISLATMDYLVEQSRRVDSFREPILRRQDLPERLARRMFLWVSAALRQHIVATYRLDPQVVDDLLEAAAVDGIDAAESPLAAPLLAEQVSGAGAVDPAMLVEILREGEVQLFSSLFARLTGLREELVLRMLFERGGEGLAIACKAVGFTAASFSSLFALASKARRKDVGELAAARSFFDRVPEKAAAKVVASWRRNQGYQAAIRELELLSPPRS